MLERWKSRYFMKMEQSRSTGHCKLVSFQYHEHNNNLLNILNTNPLAPDADPHNELEPPLTFANAMNYIRGAVSAISAPYQYYKDINPSTLTGAIDVIVIRRPQSPSSSTSSGSPDSDTYACSPFHVRFGKLQVLRPTDKKVCLFPFCISCPREFNG